MPGKFINEITGDTPAKDDLAVFFDKSKNSTAQATIAEMVNAGLDLAAGAKGQVPTIDVKVDAATSSLVNILTWGAGGGVDFKGTPTRPPTGTDEILTNDPANGLIGKTTLQQLVVAGGATILQPGTAVNTALVWNDTAGKWEPARAVSEAKNINGGATGELPFQLNTHVTAWIPLGNAGQVLTIGDIGTAGNSFIAPMWNDPVKELPTFTIADKGKQLTVKSDGKAAEWVEDAKELPTIGAKGQVLTVAETTPGVFAPNWETAPDELPAFTVADAGKGLAIKPDGTGAEWREPLPINLLTGYLDAHELTVIGPYAAIKLTQRHGPEFPTMEILNLANLLFLSELTVTHELPSLKHIVANKIISINAVSIYNSSTIVNLELYELRNVYRDLSVSDCPNFTSIAASPTIRRNYTIKNCPQATSLNHDFVVYGNVDFSGCGLVVVETNAILARLVKHDGKNGMPFFTGSVNLSGGTNAAPTGAGITAAQTLIARGCTVTVNGAAITTTKKATLNIPDFDTVADKGKTLKVKADGTGLEWVA